MKTWDAVVRSWVLWALGLTLCLAAPNATAGPAHPCEFTALNLLRADLADVRTEFWTAVAVLQNLPPGGEQNEAWDDAKAQRTESRDEAFERYEARLEFCDALDEHRYDPVIDPADFDGGASNSLFPLTPGLIRTYEGETDEGTETVIVEVTHETREIMGVECVIVHDAAYLDGELIEDTLDYFATDDAGNVWYFGENSLEYEDGFAVSTDGSWIGGEDGARPGIVMLADPQVGDVYRQEWAPREAEDGGEVVDLSVTVHVPAGTYPGCLQTADFTPIEPDTLEYKFYAPGAGVVQEVNAESGDTVELIAIVFP